MKWSKTIKDEISYLMATLAFLFGMAMTICGFIVSPVGEIHNSVLWVLGQSLTYSGGVFGIGLYVNNSKQEIKSEIRNIARRTNE